MTASGLEVEPASAGAIFGARLILAQEFADALSKHGEERGLIGPGELPRLWTRHILNCAVVASLVKPGLVADVGSGAGLPGIVLAIMRPDVEFVLIEPMDRRVTWLNEQVTELGLGNVQVLRARAEETGREGEFSQVTARAVSALAKLIPITAPLVKPGGELILMKGSGAQREIDAAAKVVRRFKLRDVEVITVGDGVLDDVTRVVRATVE